MLYDQLQPLLCQDNDSILVTPLCTNVYKLPQPFMYLTPSAPLCATRGSCQVVLNGTPMHDPSTLVGSTNSGLLVQGAVEVNTRMRNWSGTLLRGTVSVAEVKSSTCKATAYQPILPVAEYRSVHYNKMKHIHCCHAIISLWYLLFGMLIMFSNLTQIMILLICWLGSILTNCKILLCS